MAQRAAASAQQSEVLSLRAAEVEAAALITAAREERKGKLRAAAADAKKEVDEYKAQREAKLRTVQPEAYALEQRVSRLTRETDGKIASLENEFARTKEPVLNLLMQVVMSIDNPFAKTQ